MMTLWVTEPLDTKSLFSYVLITAWKTQIALNFRVLSKTYYHGVVGGFKEDPNNVDGGAVQHFLLLMYDVFSS